MKTRKRKTKLDVRQEPLSEPVVSRRVDSDIEIGQLLCLLHSSYGAKMNDAQPTNEQITKIYDRIAELRKQTKFDE